eukprot:5295423-Ditylum_brightwellii.AAC.1
MTYVIRDGPSHLGGVEFTPLYHLQGIQQVQNFLQHYITNSNTSKLLQVAVTQLQYQLGWEVSVFEDTTTPMPHIESRIYLGVTTVLDITLADGRTLDPHFRPGNKSLYS